VQLTLERLTSLPFSRWLVQLPAGDRVYSRLEFRNAEAQVKQERGPAVLPRFGLCSRHAATFNRQNCLLRFCTFARIFCIFGIFCVECIRKVPNFENCSAAAEQKHPPLAPTNFMLMGQINVKSCRMTSSSVGNATCALDVPGRLASQHRLVTATGWQKAWRRRGAPA
jgi:hypothetical protein